MAVVIIKGKGAVLWLNLGRPIVTKGPLLHSCVEVFELIELSFGVVNWVGPGIDVLDGGSRPSRGRGSFCDFSAFASPFV